MTNPATAKCILADVTPPSELPALPATAADDLLVLLAVARTARFTTAADRLGVNHTTISRRIGTLEHALGGRVLVKAVGGWELTELGRRAARVAEQIEVALGGLTAEPDAPGSELAGVVRISATDGFSAHIAAPAAAALRREHPRLAVEIETVTRRVRQYRSGIDIEVVVGKPEVHRASAVLLGGYALGMYASREYLDSAGNPTTIDALSRHPLVYFVESMLLVDDLDAPRRLVPLMRDSVSSTNVFVQVEATRAGAGVGLLPCFMADHHPDLVRVLPELTERLEYWMVLRPEALQIPAVSAVAAALQRRVVELHTQLLPGSSGVDS
ncbi:LysR family transcriptional regulator [Plantibacter flavus]|uniref:LysR family transcriptional regulator n=1 Tax=Plantibacter flavus TaxID=150123 RepID=UPI003F167A86